MELIIELAGSLLLILIACEIFVNGVEWLGHKLGLSESATGSILAAVGTALPETIVPIVAIFFYTGKSDIAVGAILGAPFMLSTAAMFVTGLAILSFYRKRGKNFNLMVDEITAKRDLKWFLVAYSLALVSGIIDIKVLEYMLAALLILMYGYYVYLNLKDERVIDPCKSELYLRHLCGSDRLGIILLQVVIALAGIFIGAHFFVKVVSDISLEIGLNPLILSLLIAPLATELPEKFNSLIWVREKKDTLAFGNISGAMVFQSTFPVSVGLLFTPWVLGLYGYISGLFALLSGFVLYIASRQKGIPVYVLLVVGLMYFVYIGVVLSFA
jgi:cation:H+ antiporter